MMLHNGFVDMQLFQNSNAPDAFDVPVHQQFRPVGYGHDEARSENWMPTATVAS
jgi:hypothetical protein